MKKIIIIFLFLVLNCSSLFAQYFYKPTTLYCDSIINKDYHNYFIKNKIFPNNKFINLVSYDSLNSILHNNNDLKLFVFTKDSNTIKSSIFSINERNIVLSDNKINLIDIEKISLKEKAGLEQSLTAGVGLLLGSFMFFSAMEGIDYAFGKDFEIDQVLYLAGGFSIFGFIGGAVFDSPKININFQL